MSEYPESQEKRISRDEMNLAEFPLTVLSTRANPKIKTLEFKDIVRSKTGEVINREWIITAADKFGLPTSSDDEVLLGLLKLTVDQGMRSRKVFFTRYELLRVLRWTTEGRSYSRLQKALDRLSGVRIKATNAFFDNFTKTHSTVNFGIIDAYEINDARDGGGDTAPSFFIWSEVLFNSFQVGYIKKLDLTFYVALESAVSKRLYRYLDKHFWYRSVLRINLFMLAHEKLGISRNYQYASSLRQQLDPALDELKARGFLSNYDYEGKGRGTEVVIYSRSGQPRSSVRTPAESKPVDLSALTKEIQSSRQFFQTELVKRGLKSKQVERLLDNRTLPEMKRIGSILEHYDYLVNSKSRLVSLSPVGFLYRAVENPYAYKLPGEKREKEAQEELTFSNSNSRAERQSERRERDDTERRSQYLVARKNAIKSFRIEVEPGLLQNLYREVDQALSKLRGLISEERFKEAVELGVEDKLLSLFSFPSFDDWT